MILGVTALVLILFVLYQDSKIRKGKKLIAEAELLLRTFRTHQGIMREEIEHLRAKLKGFK